MPRHSQAEAARTRWTILEHAVDRGSRDGLEALSIGTLAAELGLSKSGVIGHFGTKERLQLATVEAAVARFTAEVWEPVAAHPAGIERLRALMASWVSYLRRDVFPGGCFLSAASLEFDGRPGPVRDAVAAALDRWLGVIAREVAAAQAAGALDADRDPEQLAFELNAYVMAANWSKQLHGGDAGLDACVAAIDRCLGDAARARG